MMQWGDGYGQWYIENYSELVDEYNRKYNTSFIFPDEEEQDEDRWIVFLEEQYENDFGDRINEAEEQIEGWHQ